MTTSARQRVEPAHHRRAAAASAATRSTTSAIRSAAAASRPAASRWPTAADTSPAAANHAPARACSSAMCSAEQRVLELAAQHLAEDVVVAEPLAALVERDEEQVGALDLAEQPLATRRRPRTASHSGAQKRSSTQVSSRNAAPAAPAPTAPRRRGSRPGGGRSRGPRRRAARAGRAATARRGRARPPSPRCARCSSCELVRGQRERERVVEQRRGLGVAEAQLVADDLAQLAARAQARDAHRRLAPRRDHEVRRRRGRCSSRKRTPSWIAGVGDQVVVVEHEDVLPPGVDERVDQQRQRDLADARCPGAATAASKAAGTSTPALRSAAET